MMGDTHEKNRTKSIDFVSFFFKQNIGLMLQHRRHRRYLLIIGLLTVIPLFTTVFRLTIHQFISADPSDHIGFHQVRPNKTDRRFTSLAVESLITEIKRNIQNKELAWLFANCFANTLDTTVDFDIKGASENRSDTYVITGDIDVMWLRDSSAQIHPYLPLMKNDWKLRQLVEGVLRRQFICIQRDPYANAFYKDLTRISEWKDLDQTDMVEGVHERKWQLDSLCYVLRLIYSYWIEVNYDLTFFLNHKQEFHKTLGLIVQTINDQRRYNGSGIHSFIFEVNNQISLNCR